jgi:outer membrane protein OmpA-like peptidoglycan-associated protein
MGISLRLALPAIALIATPAWADDDFRIYFERDKAKITDAAFDVIHLQATAMKACPGAIAVNGHTDTSEDANALSLARAEAVKAQMLSEGVPAGSIVVTAKGDRELAVKTADDVREPLNRRVEVICGPSSLKPITSSRTPTFADILADKPASPPPPPAPVKAPPKLKPLAELLGSRPYTIHFNESSVLTPGGREQILAAATYAKSCNVSKIDLTGHAMATERNANLVAYSRALQVRDALMKEGLDATKIVAVGSVSPQVAAKPIPPATLSRYVEAVVTCAKPS